MLQTGPDNQYSQYINQLKYKRNKRHGVYPIVVHNKSPLM